MDLLPSLDELMPVVNDNNIFYECEFNTSFDNLSFEKKLQVLCDIVRQSVYPNGVPNPDNDILEMNGNCYTASYCFLNYVKSLDIGANVRCALARKRSFDLDDITTIHVVVLVDSEDGRTYQVDPTPFAGYKYGSVDDITYKGIYDEYVIINDTINTYLYKFRKIIYENSINKFDINKIDEYLKLCYVIEEFPILKGYAAIVLKIIKKYIDNEYKKNEIQKRINIIKPYNSSNIDKINALKDRLKIESDIWIEELRDLQKSNSDAKRQSELAITFVQENKWLDSSYEKFVNIGGEKVRLSSINPRFLYEKGYNTALIKSSEYFISSKQAIKSRLINEFGFPISEYVIDLFKPTEQLGVNPLLFSHPYGEKIIRTISCDTNVLLFDGIYKDINLIKKYYSKSLCNDMLNEVLTRKEDEVIYCHPFYSNLVYLTDNYSESSLNFLIGYPEHQTMTRFMYPNPRLVRKIK